MNLEQRITSNPEVCGGRPCVRGMRIRVADILEMLGQGVAEAQILTDFPDLEPEDIRASALCGAPQVLESLAPEDQETVIKVADAMLTKHGVSFGVPHLPAHRPRPRPGARHLGAGGHPSRTPSV